MKKLCLLSVLFFILLNAQSEEISGILVDNESQTPLFGVNIICGEIGTTSNALGEFTILAKVGDEISFSFIGYETITTLLKPKMIVYMLPTVLEGDEINVNANRAISGVTPVSFSNLSAKEIETRYTSEVFLWFFQPSQVFGHTVRAGMVLDIPIYQLGVLIRVE